jgi:hypothetical protein
MNNEYYVYVYCDPTKPGIFTYGEFKFNFEPFYIGKGKNNRKNYHIKESSLNKDGNKLKTNKIKKIGSPIVEIVRDNLTDYDSLNLEIELISLIGRRETNEGPLTNLTAGGEGSSGRIVSEATRQKISIKNKDKRAWNKGLTRDTSEEVKKYSDKRLGHSRTETSKLKMSKSAKKRSNSLEHKQKFIEIMNSDTVKAKRKLTLSSKNFSGENNSNWKTIDIDKLSELFLSEDPYYKISEIAEILSVAPITISKRIKLLGLKRNIKKPRSTK